MRQTKQADVSDAADAVRDPTSPPDYKAILARLQEGRELHRQRALPVRWAVLVAGCLLSIVGIALLIAPEIGLPVLLVGLRLLAYQFDWAARAYARVELLGRRFGRWYRGLSTAGKVAIWGVLIIVAALIVGWFLW